MINMINVQITRDNNVIMEWYNKDNKYCKKLLRTEYLYPTTKKNKRRKHFKTLTDIYTNEKYYLYKGKGRETPNLTVPYKVRTTKEGMRIYDYALAVKLMYFQDIIDKGLSIPHSITYDIETTSLEPSEGFITSIAWIDNQNGSEHTLLNEGSEENVLIDFINYIKKHKILSLIGFNSAKFDNRYLAYRCRQHGIYYNINNSCNIDVMKGANKLFIFGSLASIGKQLNVEEEKLDLGSENPISLYEKEKYDELLYYNLQDVRATNDIMKTLNIIDFYKALWELSWTDFNDLPFNSVLNNNLANKELWENNLMVSKCYDNALGRFSGGFNYIIEEGE